MKTSSGLSEFLAGPPETAAPQLLGSFLVSEVGGSHVRLRITEVEAYKGDDDPASHAYRGRTQRNNSMFESPGTLYVYRSYGIHHCANVAAGPEGTGWGILLRSGEVVEGESTVRRRRGRADRLTDGPGKLAQAMGIESAHDGTYLLDRSSALWLEVGPPPNLVISTPRVGISQARDRAWRYVAAVSAGS